MKRIILALFCMYQVTCFSQSSPCFFSVGQVNVIYNSSVNITSTAKGDFNLDGKMDFVFTNYTGNPVLMMGDGAGGFTSSNLTNFTNPPNSVSMKGLVVADYNSDGKPDVAVFRIDNVIGYYILFGNGNGTFATPVFYASNGGNYGWESGDFNGDGKPDLAFLTGSGAPSIINVALNSGTGTFLTPQTTTIGTDAFAMNVFDFNNDGKSDVVATHGPINTVSILKGNGNGTFSVSTFSTSGNPVAVATNDFNNDSFSDLAVVDNTVHTVKVFSGDGAGNFSLTSSYTVCNLPWDIKCGDLNADGKKDLVVLGPNNDEISVLLANSSGGFLQAQHYAIGDGPSTCIIDDFDSDSKTDLIIGGGGNNNDFICLFKGTGTGIFSSPRTYFASYDPRSVTANDFNGDGYADLATTNGVWWYSTTTIEVLMNQAGTGFGPSVSINVGAVPTAITSSDYNGDGLADIAVASTSSIRILINNGSGNFLTPAIVNTGSLNCEQIISRDFNADGKIDLAFANSYNGSLEILKNNGNGIFSSAYGLSNYNASAVAAGDFNNDGIMDVACPGSSLVVGFGSGSGVTYTINPLTIPGVTFQTGTALTAGDFNGDGRDDLAGGGRLFLANASGGFNSPIANIYIYGAPGGVEAADLNGDGIDDYVTNGGLSYSSILIGSSSGSFAPAIRMVSGGGWGLAIKDLNNDGHLDFVSTYPGNQSFNLGHVGVLMNNGQQASVTISGPDIACDGIPIILTASGAAGYTWDNSATTATNSVIQYTTTTYSVIGIQTNGCADAAVKTVSVSKITTTLSSSFVCPGEQTSISASGAVSYTWSTGDVGPTIVITPLTNTTYTINGTDAGGCHLVAITGQSISACTDINEIENSGSFSVYPNPASDEVYFKWPVEAPVGKMELFNATGLLVKEIQLGTDITTLNVKDLKPGIYIYRVVNNNKSIEGKIIVE